MNTEESKGTVLSALLLVAGTSIGGGMLALPVATGISGFVPSTIMMFFCWLAMTVSALLLVEVSLWFEEGAHVITMTSRLLGPIGVWISWILYLFVAYASLIAYTSAGGSQIAEMFNISDKMAALLFVLVFGGLVYLGSRILGRINTILVIGLIGSYIGLVGLGIDEIKPQLLLHKDWKASVFAIPLLLTTFSFQTMVPSLTPYLKRNVKKLRIAIVGGTAITFIIYAIWQCLILGIVPVEGVSGLAEAFDKGEPATRFTREHVNGQWVGSIVEYFAFFAIITSFLGIGMGLFDFLSDGLKIKKKGIGRVFLGILIAAPVYLIATRYERIFLLALDSTGGYGDTILNGMIPVLMVWIGRYHMKLQGEKLVLGGKVALSLIFLFFTAGLTIEILSSFP